MGADGGHSLNRDFTVLLKDIVNFPTATSGGFSRLVDALIPFAFICRGAKPINWKCRRDPAQVQPRRQPAPMRSKPAPVATPGASTPRDTIR